MKLHEAMLEVLRTAGTPLSATEISDAIARRGLYVRRDGQRALPGQISARARKYAYLFQARRTLQYTPARSKASAAPLKPMVLYIFQSEVRRQCEFAVAATKDLDAALQADDQNRVWLSVQSFLVACGNISKLLWPTQERIANRGEALRRSLSVGGNSPLRVRSFRNHFEHFDDRLEKWANSSKRSNFVDSNIMPAGAICGLDSTDFLRNLDPTTRTITFRGDTYDLQAAFNAVCALLSEAQKATSRPWWKNAPPSLQQASR